MCACRDEMRLWMYPEFTFLCRNGKSYAPVNLDRIQHWIDQGRLTSSPEKPITARDLLLSGCIHDVHDGIKLLGDVRCSLFFLRYLLNVWFLGC